jgi:predicted membrane chloride channel (bestrophin family)
MTAVRNFLKIVDIQTVLISILAVTSTYICTRFGFYADLPWGLIGIAIIFPIVFSINSAYRRREEALKYFASLKGHAVAIFYAHRDWVKGDPQHGERVKNMIQSLFCAIKEYFSSSAEKEEAAFGKVYRELSKFSLSHEKLREADVPANEVSRLNQYLRQMLIDFEKMRNILLYRTPKTLRAYSQIFLNVFPILYAPYFANLCKESYAVVGYGVAILYSVVLVSLDNIQENLESPYDSVGADDVNLDVIDEYMGVMQ